jgi:hypothetical protein
MLDMFMYFFARRTSFQEAIHGLAHTSHAFFDVTFFWISEAEAEVLLAAAIDVEWLSGDEGHLFIGGLAQERTRTQVTRQAAPQMKAAVWVVYAHFFRPVLADSLEHQVAFALIAFAQHQQMVVDQVSAQYL